MAGAARGEVKRLIVRAMECVGVATWLCVIPMRVSTAVCVAVIVFVGLQAEWPKREPVYRARRYVA